jgi:hypothetical protein
MEAARSSETSVYNKPTRRHIQEYGILHSHRREDLKSCLYIPLCKQAAIYLDLVYQPVTGLHLSSHGQVHSTVKFPFKQIRKEKGQKQVYPFI